MTQNNIKPNPLEYLCIYDEQYPHQQTRLDKTEDPSECWCDHCVHGTDLLARRIITLEGALARVRELPLRLTEDPDSFNAMTEIIEETLQGTKQEIPGWMNDV